MGPLYFKLTVTTLPTSKPVSNPALSTSSRTDVSSRSTVQSESALHLITILHIHVSFSCTKQHHFVNSACRSIMQRILYITPDTFIYFLSGFIPFGKARSCVIDAHINLVLCRKQSRLINIHLHIVRFICIINVVYLLLTEMSRADRIICKSSKAWKYLIYNSDH